MYDHGNGIFVTGIDTGVGKTIAASILVRALAADYWKPIQCGNLEASDSQEVTRLVGEMPGFICHPERYRFSLAASPHLAAAHEGQSIALDDFTLPVNERPLIVEGAGGVLVPLNREDWIIDLAARFGMCCVVVSKQYLGSFNHSFLTIEAIKRRGIFVLGLITNGVCDANYSQFICERAGVPLLLHINEEKAFSPQLVTAYAETLQTRLPYGRRATSER